MNNQIALYPTSAAPPTWGHADLMARGAAHFGRLIWVAALNPNKVSLFSVQSRLDMMQDYVDYYKLNNVSICSYEGSIARLAHTEGARVIIRGLRGPQDLPQEMELAQGYRGIKDDLETFCLFADPNLVRVSSSMVRELARLGESIEAYVLPEVAKIVYKELTRH
ncbi:MAG: pantetheine-phosphate adenylyltransferase [Candidatus Lambdaproteobacteria bacterium RIFOXYD12_FULL_49_8]|uniref:Phosphopantetheine adenylyltransferase n=1 Tax=Candidatus Lambdaproteobacteria bacterium RIFOXYD2_FULL_50_16 TaxID=1817772 RepID=A0A1F6G5Z6_9PROT|nr:MAG: pantetheine-phosphate adenylyltransferase [Candidatus Lambdaproteobacteria bacterium RIFOXYD2_FULL_50_16]OGG98035.1 MAG: pantetheine-phosphate adenylyltransferase [Candidatus Lambdaproteobacteria bacterium RIFOXYD12_FULL_49_8]